MSVNYNYLEDYYFEIPLSVWRMCGLIDITADGKSDVNATYTLK